MRHRFDDMINYLRQSNAAARKRGDETQRFGQVVAIDMGFELFSRRAFFHAVSVAHLHGMSGHLTVSTFNMG